MVSPRTMILLLTQVPISTSTSARPISPVNPQTARRWSCNFSLWERCFPQPKISGFPSRLASTPWAVCLLKLFALFERGGRWLEGRCDGRSVELFIVFPSCSRHWFARITEKHSTSNNQGGGKPRPYPVRSIQPPRRRVGAGLAPALVNRYGRYYYCCVSHMSLPLHAPQMFRSVGQHRHMSRLFEGDGQAALVFRARSRFAAGFDLATIRNVAFHETAGIFIINLTNVIVTKLANFAARWPLATRTAAIAPWGGIRSSLHGLFSSSLSPAGGNQARRGSQVTRPGSQVKMGRHFRWNLRHSSLNQMMLIWDRASPFQIQSHQ